MRSLAPLDDPRKALVIGRGVVPGVKSVERRREQPKQDDRDQERHQGPEGRAKQEAQH